MVSVYDLQQSFSGFLAMQRLVATYLFDNSTIYREGLKSILSDTRFRIVRQYNLSDVATFELPKAKWRELFFAIGVEGDVEQATSVLQWCAAVQAPKRIALISNRAELDQVLKAVRLGADGYLLKSMNSKVLLKSLELVALGERLLPSAITNLLCDKPCDLVEVGAQQGGGDIGGELHEVQFQVREFPARSSFSSREAAVLNRLMNGEFEQEHRSQTSNCRGHGESARQGHSAENPGQEPHPGSNVGRQSSLDGPYR